jgi:signal transduction histidine kinase
LQSINAASLFDADGRLVFQTVAPNLPEAAPEHHNPVSLVPPNFRAALEGNTVSILSAPGTPPATYRPASDTYVIETYLPFQPASGGAPIGVLATARAAPELGEALVASRRLGLGLAALSLGGLFLALLFVVRRADQLITNRTRELEGAYRDLRQAEGLRDDLTRMIVHDLRNPLTTILANLELLGKTLSNPSFADARPRFLAGARSAGKRIIGLIDDLLNVGKFEAGELQPALTPVYLPTLLAEKEEDYRSQIEREEKTLTLHAPAELPTVMADVELISRVIDNLVSNAIKYTEPDAHIEIRVERQAHALCVRVCDDGQGIPPAYHTRIFDKFVRVPDGSGGPLRKGTGLGLAFCRLAVEAHQGRIWVESAPGRGSTFSFTLPL